MSPSLCRTREKKYPLTPAHPRNLPNQSPISFILRMIFLMLLVHFSLKALTSQRFPLKNKKGTTVRRGLIPHIENMVFDDDD
jgi:hypothetical protein